MDEIKYKRCPYCGGTMKLVEGEVYTSIPPQYKYKCPECGGTDYDTRYFPDPPEIKAPIVVYDDNKPTDASYAVKFRNEAAKDILCAFASRLESGETPDVFDPKFYAEIAIEWADELIRQLREEKI